MSNFTGSCLEAFLEMAGDHSHDRITHPNTHALQEFIRDKVLPQGPREEQAATFLTFANDVAGRCLNEPCLCDSFQGVMQLIPEETSEHKRIKHALRKVAIDVGAYKPVW